ncbi:hypothetical protein [Nocardia miyunensis]|uniref:hypothetical protein n=1 Tax=Nocardia miyunensis TaxID=282684 RepID=UPI00082AD31A|nr:hypothetical protein [Nocardia miyunensis]
MIQPCGTGVASVCQPDDHVTDLRGGYRGGAHNGRSTSDGFDRLGTTPGPGAPLGAFAPGYFDTVPAGCSG